MKKHIVISVSSDLSTDQRVLKVARSCFENGYEVLLVGRKLKNSSALDLPFATKRMRLVFKGSVFFYAEFSIRLFFLLLFARVDVLLSNDTDTLLPNFVVAKLRNKKLVFDAHELFPEVPELVRRPFVRSVWMGIEKLIFPYLTHAYTVCDSIANYYEDRYGLSMRVVRNVPYKDVSSNSIYPPELSSEKIIIYQGALNIGRGLEWVIDAMPNVQGALLFIIGDGDLREQLELQVCNLKLENKVRFLGKLPFAQMQSYTRVASIGLCLLEKRGLSYYFALPNRVFDYIHAGVPILATRFPEIEKVVSICKTGVLVDSYERVYLSQQIQKMIDSPFDTSHFSEISTLFCWENEQNVVLEVIESALLA